jgi:hypothetical protein
MSASESQPWKKDQRSSSNTKIILVAWLVIVVWNSEQIFNPVTEVPVEQSDPRGNPVVSPIDQPANGVTERSS